jgi:hypothetical protein
LLRLLYMYPLIINFFFQASQFSQLLLLGKHKRLTNIYKIF